LALALMLRVDRLADRTVLSNLNMIEG